jgi:hypothetical protein
MNINSTNLNIAPLARISPSHFSSLRACALYAACVSARQPPLLPSYPASKVGSIAHRLIERAASGEFATADRSVIECAWDAMVAEVQLEMQASPLERRFVPLYKAMPQYQVRRIQACLKAEMIAKKRLAIVENRKRLTHFEVWLATPDGRVGGYIDYLEETDEGTVIRDYKTGPILDTAQPGTEARVKNAYSTQLRLYAALYWANTGRWPRVLELVPLAGNAVAVPFEPEQCLGLLEEAKGALDSVNARIGEILGSQSHQIERLASPAPETCRFCSFRPECSGYWKTRSNAISEAWPIDVRGHVGRRKELANGQIMLEIEPLDQGETCRVRGLRSSKYPILSATREGAFISLYNLRPDGAPNTFADTSLTAIYHDGLKPALRPVAKE